MDTDAPKALRAEVEARLRPVCADWPEELFQTVLDQIVAITVKYDRQSVIPALEDREGTESLIADLKDLARRNSAFRRG